MFCSNNQNQSRGDHQRHKATQHPVPSLHCLSSGWNNNIHDTTTKGRERGGASTMSASRLAHRVCCGGRSSSVPHPAAENAKGSNQWVASHLLGQHGTWVEGRAAFITMEARGRPPGVTWEGRPTVRQSWQQAGCEGGSCDQPRPEIVLVPSQ